MPVRHTKYKMTDDDWAPTLAGSMVRVTLSVDLPHFTPVRGKMQFAGVWHRVSVWGGDDDGMEMDFMGEESRQDAELMYHELCARSKVNKRDLKELGFVRA